MNENFEMLNRGYSERAEIHHDRVDSADYYSNSEANLLSLKKKKETKFSHLDVRPSIVLREPQKRVEEQSYAGSNDGNDDIQENVADESKNMSMIDTKTTSAKKVHFEIAESEKSDFALPADSPSNFTSLLLSLLIGVCLGYCIKCYLVQTSKS